MGQQQLEQQLEERHGWIMSSRFKLLSLLLIVSPAGGGAHLTLLELHLLAAGRYNSQSWFLRPFPLREG